ncbi:hypothetical protein Tco_1377385 [Tanacetum coccineum]
MASDGSDPDAKYALSRLLQRGTMAEYQNEFEMLIRRVTRKSESLLQTVYIFGLKPALQCSLLRSNPKTLDEAFSLARATKARFTNLQLLKILKLNHSTLGEAFFKAHIIEARFEDERSTTHITKTNDLNVGVQVQDLEETIRHKPNKVEAFQTKKDGAKPPISTDTFGSNGGNDSRTSGSETPAKEVVDNGIESEVVVGFPEEFQEGDMVDALSRVEQKSFENWKELDNESKDKKVERDAEREGEPTILATFCRDQGITIWDLRINIFLDDTLRARWF